MMPQSLLQAEQLVKTYRGQRAVHEVSFEVQSGQVVGLLGPNGAGKTTSFYMVVGLIRPESGKVRLNGMEITRWPMHQRAQQGIAYLPQEASVFRRMSVEENILCVLETRSFKRKERFQKLQQLMEDFHLQHLAQQKAYSLSGGERRRVEVARALAIDPMFLLLDEPFAGIDPIAVGDIQKMVRTLKQKNIGILITDHNVRETLEICDLGYLLSHGKILEKGTPDEMIQSQAARKAYLGEDFQW